VAAYIGEEHPFRTGTVERDAGDGAEGARREPGDYSSAGHMPDTEAVIREFTRPVLLIRNSKIEIPRSLEMRNRLLPARARLADCPGVWCVMMT
jgi:hypothetical protein